MALNPNTNATMAGRITLPTADYPYGSSKDETSPGAGDGTPYFAGRANDIFGFQQALLRAASIVPNGNADTALASEYVQAIVEIASGRAFTYDEHPTSVANAYVLQLKTGQQGFKSLADGQIISFTAAAANTSNSTIDVSLLLGQSLGTTLKSISRFSTTFSNVQAGRVSGKVFLMWSAARDAFVFRDAFEYYGLGELPRQYTTGTLNSYTTPGFFGVFTSAVTELPTASTYAVAVIGTNSTLQLGQIAYELPASTTGGGVFFRKYYSGTWSEWYSMLSGKYGIGGKAGSTTDIDAVSEGGFYIVTAGTAGTKPSGVTSGNLIMVERGSSSQRTQIFDALIGAGSEQALFTRTRRNDGTWTSWVSSLSLGAGQAWQDVSGSRLSGVTYTNTTGKPIQLSISLQAASASSNSFSLNIGGVVVASGSAAATVLSHTLNHVIPHNSQYTLTVTGSMGITTWTELR